MNKSKYIKSENCKNCGLCCKSFSIFYDKEIEKIEPNFFSEVQRFKELNTDKIEVKEHDKTFEVIFKFPCKNLLKNNSCKTYNQSRPLLCEEYPYKNTIKQDCPFMEK
jgi:Fe-S-cluster containining protein